MTEGKNEFAVMIPEMAKSLAIEGKVKLSVNYEIKDNHVHPHLILGGADYDLTDRVQKASLDSFLAMCADELR